ncbi:hypothetical protein V6Z12_D08G191300 [Gossypium hirsutum]
MCRAFALACAFSCAPPLRATPPCAASSHACLRTATSVLPGWPSTCKKTHTETTANRKTTA